LDITSPGTKYPIEPMFSMPMTMAISMTTASHDTTQPTLFTLPIALVSTPQQQHQIEIAHGVE